MSDNYSSDFLSHHMKPIEQVIGFRAQIELDIPYSVATIREKLDLLIRLHPLGLQDLEQAAFGLRVKGLHKAKALRGYPETTLGKTLYLLES